MRFVNVRELRSRSAEIWRELSRKGDLVITSNGKPIAIVSATNENRLEESLMELRRIRAARALTRLRERSVQSRRNRLSARQIESEIIQARRARSRTQR